VTAPLPFIIFGCLTVFLTILAPPLVLLAWLFSWPVWPMVFLAAVLAPVLFLLIRHSLAVSHNMLLRWCWMQILGLGTVLMPLVFIGLFFTAFVTKFKVGVVVLCIWMAVSLVALLLAHTIKIRKLRFSSTSISEPIRLVQISDVHIGSRRAGFLKKVISRVNAQTPKLLLITGDLLDSSTVSTADLSALQDTNCPSYMCIGNHERYVDLDKALESIAENGVKVLRNACVHVNGVTLIGIDDKDSPEHIDAILAELKLPDTQYKILLYHRPDGWEAALKHNVDLTLAGHTHAGQMWPFGYFVKRQYPNMAGLFKQENRALFVSTGMGTWGPIFRLGTRCEMTVIDLHPPGEHA